MLVGHLISRLLWLNDGMKWIRPCDMCVCSNKILVASSVLLLDVDGSQAHVISCFGSHLCCLVSVAR